MKLWKKIATILLLLLVAMPLGAHTVILRNGKVLYGNVSQQDRSNIYLLIKGKKETISKRNVLKILFQEVKDKPAIKKIIRVEIIKKKRVNEEADIEIVNYDEYMKEILAEESQRKLRWEMSWRSAILPGWGHWHGNQSVRGSIYGTLYLASLGSAFSFSQQNKKAYSDYNDTTIPALYFIYATGTNGILARSMYYAPIRDRISSTSRSTEIASVAALLVWTGALVNAYFYPPAAASTTEESTLRYDLMLDTTASTRKSAFSVHNPDSTIFFRMSMDF
jgi:hypothetical protein